MKFTVHKDTGGSGWYDGWEPFDTVADSPQVAAEKWHSNAFDAGAYSIAVTAQGGNPNNQEERLFWQRLP